MNTKSISLSPAEKETAKTTEQQVEDVAYTMNHAIACTATDVAAIPVSAFTGKFLGRHVHIGCAHDHGGSGWRWTVGEAVGDVAAVPLTIGMQRFAPGLMAGIGNVLAVPLGPVYHLGAEHSAGQWAKRHGVSAYSQEYRDKVEATYRHEMDHLPQAAIWSSAAALGNIATQKWMLRSEAPWWQLGIAKLAGASFSIVGLLGLRAMAPETAHDWDRWTSHHIFIPATKLIGQPFGVGARSVEKMVATDEHPESWRQRVAEPASEERGV